MKTSSFSTKDFLTVIVLGHPVNSHPDISLIERTVESLKLLNLAPETKIVLSHDRPKRDLTKQKKVNFDFYLDNLSKRYRDASNLIITVTPKHSFLSGNIRHALTHVETKYVLLVQHDLAFSQSVNIRALLSAMESHEEIKHVRFNKRPNYVKEGWDFYPQERLEFVKEKSFNTDFGDLELLTTLAWSDQNHLTTVTYYRDLVLPLCSKYKVYPEDMLNPFTRSSLFGFFGNFVYGSLSDDAFIDDLDGSKGRWEEMTRLDSFKRRAKMSIHYRINKFKILKMVLK